MKTLTTQEAADLLKIHPDTVIKRARTGALPAVKIGRSWVFQEDRLRQMLERTVVMCQPVKPGRKRRSIPAI